MTRARWLVAALLVLLAGCATSRVVPVPAAGVQVDPETRAAAAVADGVQVVVRPSAWRGSPSYLTGYVTPFHFAIANETAFPLRYDYADLKLFDEDRFQYTALPPVDVTRILRGVAVAEPVRPTVVAAASVSTGSLHWRRAPYAWPWGWDPWWWGPPVPYYWPPPRYDEVLTEALPVGTLDPGARTAGFVYFPRLRPDARRLVLEFHHRLGDTPRVLTLPFAIERR
jgi:hypothetical protein